MFVYVLLQSTTNQPFEVTSGVCKNIGLRTEETEATCTVEDEEIIDTDVDYISDDDRLQEAWDILDGFTNETSDEELYVYAQFLDDIQLPLREDIDDFLLLLDDSSFFLNSF